MKNIYAGLLVIIALFILPEVSRGQGCVNADFSTGDFTGWTGTTSQNQCTRETRFGCSCNKIDPAYAPGIVQGPNDAAVNSTTEYYQVITTTAGGYDNNLTGYGYNLPTVYPGNSYSARIGSMWQLVGYSAGSKTGDGESVSYSFVVTPDNCIFTYHYAVVLDNGFHSAGQQPYFNISMSSSTMGTIACGQFEVDATTAQTIGGFMSSPGDSLLWKPWSTVTVPLINYMGQTITVTFTTRGCIPNNCAGEHYAYAYVAAECSAANFGFTASSSTVCGENDTLSAPPGYASYSWSGPGIVGPNNNQQVIITKPGDYSVNLTTFANTPCPFTLDTVINTNSIPPPAANFTFSSGGCSGDTVSFQDLSTSTNGISAWQWSFGDGNPASTENATHIFSSGGTFPVTLSVTSGSCIGDTTIPVLVGQVPTANFSAQSPVCLNAIETITYTGNAPSSATYNWSFDGGTGNQLTGPGPLNLSWATTGTKSIILTVVSGSCTSQTDTVPVIVAPLPVDSIIADKTNPCSGDSAQICSTPGFVSYQWNTGLTGNCIVVKQTGNYYVTITDNNGCSAQSNNINISIVPVPVDSISADKTIFCANDSAHICSVNSFASYQWNNGGGDNCISANQAGPYFVIVTDINGCTAESNHVTISTIPAPVDTIYADKNIFCAYDSATLCSANIFPSYQWNTGASGSCVIAKQAGVYFVVVTDTNGCKAQSNHLPISIYPAIDDSITADKAGFCPDESVNICAQTGFVLYRWSTGATGDCIITKQAGNYYVTLSDNNGCTALSNTLPIAAYASPTDKVIADKTRFCPHDSASICSVNEYRLYEWNTGANTSCITVTEGGDYYLMVTDNNGCTAVSNYVSIELYPVPSIPVFEDGNVLSTYGAASYQWYLDGNAIINATTDTCIARQTGSYTVAETDSFGCSALSAPVEITTAGISEIGDARVMLYPNPSPGNWQLTVTTELIGSTIAVYDDEGRVIFQSEIRNLESEFRLNVASGIYWLAIYTGNTVIVRKLVRL